MLSQKLQAKREKVIFGVLLISIGIVWGRRLFESFWIDETLTVWVAEGSWSDLFSRAFLYQGQSPFYYLLPWTMMQLGLEGEFWIRLPSFLSALGVLFFAYKILRLFVCRFVAVLGLLFFLAGDGAIFTAVSARPYALALFFSSGALYCALVFFQQPRWSLLFIGSLFQLFSVLSNYFFFANIFPVILFALFFHTGARSRKVQLLLSYGCFSLLALAICHEHLFFLINRMNEISTEGAPSFVKLFILLLNGPVLIFLLFSSFAVKDMRVGDISDPPGSELFWIGALWYVTPPVALFLLAYFLDTLTLFTERYLLCHFLSFPFLLSLLVQRYLRKSAQPLFAAVFACLFLVADCYKEFPTQDWKGAVQKLQQMDSGAPVFLYSGLFETSSIEFLKDPESQPYLIAPLRVYGFTRSVTPIPFSLSQPVTWEYWKQQLELARQRPGEYVMVIHNATTLEGEGVTSFFEVALEQEGFSVQERTDFKRVAVLSFKAQKPEISTIDGNILPLKE